MGSVTRTRAPAIQRATIVVTAIYWALLPLLAIGQPDPVVKSQDTSPIETKVGADYFTARFDPNLREYLISCETTHAKDLTWGYYRTGLYSEALADCKYTLARFPNHPGALFLMGEIAKVTRQTSMPINYFEAALKSYPQYAYTHAQYGHYLIEIGAISAGVAELREALRLDPDQLQARAWLAEVLTPGAGQGPIAPSDSTKGGTAGAGAERLRGSSRN